MSDYLPTEVVVEILSRLPVKSLLRAMSVSKLWKSVISSTYFIDTHLKKSSSSTRHFLLLKHYSPNKNPRIEQYMFRSDYGTADECLKFSSPFKAQCDRLHFVGAFNGLICLCDGWFVDALAIFLWNPSIRRYVILPPSILTPKSCSNTVMGFGFDLKSKDYKVVRISYPYRIKTMFCFPVVEVFTLGTGRWKLVPDAVPSCSMLRYMSHVSLNGVCHWIGYKRSNGRLCEVVVSFDLGDEVFRVMEIPEKSADVRPQKVGFNLLQNMISKSFIDVSGDHPTFSKWTMREYGVAKYRTKRCNISLQKEEKREKRNIIVEEGKAVYHFQGYNYARVGCIETVYACYNMESLVLLNGSSGDLESRVITHGGTRIRDLI